MLNRRSFLATLAAAFVADPERLLWVPGKKLISIPSPAIEISMERTIAAQIEFVRPRLEVLFVQSGSFWARMAEKDAVSMGLSRAPFIPQRRGFRV